MSMRANSMILPGIIGAIGLIGYFWSRDRRRLDVDERDLPDEKRFTVYVEIDRPKIRKSENGNADLRLFQQPTTIIWTLGPSTFQRGFRFFEGSIDWLNPQRGQFGTPSVSADGRSIAILDQNNSGTTHDYIVRLKKGEVILNGTDPGVRNRGPGHLLMPHNAE